MMARANVFILDGNVALCHQRNYKHDLNSDRHAAEV